MQTQDGTPIFLLNDTVHILKCIRNNWITEKLKILEYKMPHETFTREADWKYLKVGQLKKIKLQHWR